MRCHMALFLTSDLPGKKALRKSQSQDKNQSLGLCISMCVQWQNGLVNSSFVCHSKMGRL